MDRQRKTFKESLEFIIRRDYALLQVMNEGSRRICKGQPRIGVRSYTPALTRKNASPNRYI